ncbi:protein ABHD11 isoform X2 [Gopherus evgoodei]|uniref:protein ABHD11 isoform X2 n=1 Tax=Gopherus evgoodei TaxID=1825980 RepID=UPI0011CF20FD|nr:protein ABHD11 isoform X2 [Gopherus evgoodei]
MSGETRMYGNPVSLVQPAQLAFCPQPGSCSRPMFCLQPSSVLPPAQFSAHVLQVTAPLLRSVRRACAAAPTRLPARPAGQQGQLPRHRPGPGAAEWPQDLVERLVSVDISPTESVAVTDFLAYISAMRRVSIPNGIPRSTARRLAEDQLRPAIQVSAVRQFLLTNLVEAEGRYMWRVNLEAISHHIANIMGFPVFHTPYPGPTLFLAGSDSPYVSSEDYPEIERLFPEAEIQYIPGAGHWVHADKSQEFITAICNFLLLP